MEFKWTLSVHVCVPASPARVCPISSDGCSVVPCVSAERPDDRPSLGCLQLTCLTARGLTASPVNIDICASCPCLFLCACVSLSLSLSSMFSCLSFCMSVSVSRLHRSAYCPSPRLFPRKSISCCFVYLCLCVCVSHCVFLSVPVPISF